MTVLSDRGSTPAAPEKPVRRDFAERISALTDRRRRMFLVTWLLLVAVAGAGASTLASTLSGGGWYVAGSQSEAASEALASSGMLARGESAVTLVVHDEKFTAGQAEFAGRAGRVAAAITGDDRIRPDGSYGWFTVSAQGRDAFVGKDDRTIVQAYALGIDDGAARRELPLVQKDLTDRFAGDGLTVSLVSPSSFWGEVNVVSAEGLARAELFTLPLIALVLVLLFRSAAAALVSLAVSVSAILFTLGILSPIAATWEISSFAQNAATMLGLGVAVDYSLFIISRFTEELDRGAEVRAAVTTALRHSGHTVLASGFTVVAAMSSLFVMKLNVIISIALGSVIVVAMSILASTLLLPVLLHMVGHGINRWRLPWPRRKTQDQEHSDGTAGPWHRIALAIMRRPIIFALAGAALLGALALPFTQLRTFSPDARIVPESSPVRQGYDLMQTQFGVGTTSPVQVVVTADARLDDPAVWQNLSALNDRLTALPHVASVSSVVTTARTISPAAPAAALADVDGLPGDARQAVRNVLSTDGRTTVLDLVPDARASDDAARDLVAAVRTATAGLPGMRAWIGGETAEGLDANNVIQDRLPTAFVIMLAVVFLLLMFTFRSLVIPVKAVAMNVLSLGATYGILVLIFQQGHLTGPLGLDKTDYLQNFVPVLLLALLFSLSTDYEVFLLDRVRENYRRTGDNTTAVASGVQSTARLISGAALLMVVVFGTFGLNGIVPIQQLGIGMAVAIILDATVVRLILVPATMRLLGRWNWWFPGRAAR